MNNHVFLFSLLLFCRIHATDDSSRNQPSNSMPNNGIALNSGIARGILLAHFRAQFLQAHPQATQQEINNYIEHANQTITRQTEEFLAQHRAHRLARAP